MILFATYPLYAYKTRTREIKLVKYTEEQEKRSQTSHLQYNMVDPTDGSPIIGKDAYIQHHAVGVGMAALRT